MMILYYQRMSFAMTILTFVDDVPRVQCCFPLLVYLCHSNMAGKTCKQAGMMGKVGTRYQTESH